MFECCKPKPKKDASNPKPIHSRNERLLVFAAGDIGVKEYPGKAASNPHIEKYHAYAREDNDLSKGLTDDVPFCASALCYWLESVGMGSTNSALAKSYLKWGIEVKKNFLPGDILVFDRGGWKGHVGLLVTYNANYVWCLGANQNDAVNVTKYSRQRLVSVRRSSIQQRHGFTTEQKDRLHKIANDILNGHPVSLAGSMA